MSVSVSSVSATVMTTVVGSKSSDSETLTSKKETTPSTIVTISSDSIDDDHATALAELEASGPIVALKNLGGAEQLNNYIKEYSEYTLRPKEVADNSLRRVSAELVRLQDKIETNRPSMLGKQWDFVLNENNIEVVNDNLSAKDRQWLENTLNRNQKLFSAVSNFYGAVTKYYDNTADHASATLRDSTSMQTGFVTDAGSQINGRLAVRDIMDKSIASLNQPNAYLSSDAKKPFQNSIELAAKYFKADLDPKYQVQRFDLSEPVTAQYLRDNPGFYG